MGSPRRKNGRAGGPRIDDLPPTPPRSTADLDLHGISATAAAAAPGWGEESITQAAELPPCPRCGTSPIELALLREKLHGLVVAMRQYRELQREILARAAAPPAGDPVTVRCRSCGGDAGAVEVLGVCSICRAGGGA